MSSGTISTLGIGSGMDLQGILDSLKAADKALITKKTNQKNALIETREEFNAVNAKMLSLKTHSLSLSLGSNYLKRNTSVTDDSVINASAVDGTKIDSHSISVSQLASKHSFQSSGFASKTGFVTAETKTFSYTIGNSDPIEISVNQGTTLSGFADLINNDENNPGVTASIIDKGSGDTPFHLVLTANETGEDNRIEINSQLEDILMEHINGNSIGDLNAKVILNNITYERPSNTINDVIKGVTLSLKKTGVSSLTINKETSSIKEDIIGLITCMNEIITEIDANDDYDEETDTWGSLSKISSIKVAKNSIITIMGTPINNMQGAITNFYDLGFEIDRDGTVKIDEKILDEKIVSNFDSISEFFSGNIDNNIIGMAEILKDKINEITNYSGIINNEKNSAQTKIDRINEQIDKETEKLNKRYEIMTKQFVELDSFMKKMESQTNYVTQMFNSMQSSSKDS